MTPISFPKIIVVQYYGSPLTLHMPKDADNNLDIGRTILTRTGEELARICAGATVDSFWEYVQEIWKGQIPMKDNNQTARPNEGSFAMGGAPSGRMLADSDG
jgi:hypothetical protein